MQHFTVQTERNYSLGMGTSGRKLWLALVAFGAGGLLGSGGATRNASNELDRFIRSAETRAAHAARAESSKAVALNALPLLPAPVTSVLSESPRALTEVQPITQVNLTSAVIAPSSALAHQRVATGSVGVSAMNIKPPTRTKKSASWTRRSEIIDPWTARR